MSNGKEDTKKEAFVERRKHRRILFETFGSAKKKGLAQSKECYIQNLGIGGAMVYFSSDWSIGEEIGLSFKIGNRKFKRDCIVKAVRNFSDSRRYILRIGKSLDFTSFYNISFTEPLDISDFEYIKLNYLHS